jgi:hypothetical protein
MDTISNAEKLDKQLKSNVLVRVYPEGKNKQAHYLPLNFLDVGGEIVKSKYINTWEKELVGYHNTKQNEILISTPISNRIISYNYMANSHSIKNIENYIDGIYEGYETINKALTRKRPEFNQYNIIHHDKDENLYYRQLGLVNSKLKDSKHLGVSVILIMDSLLNPMGIAKMDSLHSLIGIDHKGCLVLINNAFSPENKEFHFKRYKVSKEHNLIQDTIYYKEKVLLPKLKDSDIAEYLNSIIPLNSNYENIIIIPYDNTCPSCINDLQYFLNQTDTIHNNTALLFLFSDKFNIPGFKKQNNFEAIQVSVYLDSTRLFDSYFDVPNSFYHYKKKKRKFVLFKEYEPLHTNLLFEFLNPNLTLIGPSCKTIE